jgi:Carbonic anhydrase
MITRRFLCGCIPLAATSVIATSQVFAAKAECTVYTADRQRALSPDEAIGLLKEGNERFASGRTVNCDLLAQAKETANGQAPFAAIVGCMDSRVPPELVFDQKIGDVFSVRIAGNFVEENIIGSLEFATKVTGVRAIVVLGHNSCGAIRGAIDNVHLGNLTSTLANIRPAVEATAYEGDRTTANSAFVQAVAEENVRRAVALLTERSDINASLVEAGELRIVGAMHDLATGTVKFLS